MDLQTRKLNLITYLAQIQDESFFDKIENYILKKYKKNQMEELELQPFTIDELVNRSKKSEQDYIEGNFKTQEHLEKISANW
ncbi:MAG: hypothetical protein Q4G16_05360 [Cruoricaptor ignavus]|nr:hypothetical protein [Cruoricaptor ignavus]